MTLDNGVEKGRKKKTPFGFKKHGLFGRSQERSHERLACEASVQIHDKDTSGLLRPATARNYSKAGRRPNRKKVSNKFSRRTIN
jgi:hypothetical protein